MYMRERKSKHEVNWLDVLEKYRPEHCCDWLSILALRQGLHQSHSHIAIETEISLFFHKTSTVSACYCSACISSLLSSGEKSAICQEYESYP